MPWLKYDRNFRTFTETCISDFQAHCERLSFYVSDFQVHCERLSFYEDGISGTMWKLFQPSPWVAWIGLNAFVHVCWVTMLFGCQLYQVSQQTSLSFTLGCLDRLECLCSCLLGYNTLWLPTLSGKSAN